MCERGTDVLLHPKDPLVACTPASVYPGPPLPLGRHPATARTVRQSRDPAVAPCRLRAWRFLDRRGDEDNGCQTALRYQLHTASSGFFRYDQTHLGEALGESDSGTGPAKTGTASRVSITRIQRAESEVGIELRQNRVERFGRYLSLQNTRQWGLGIEHIDDHWSFHDNGWIVEPLAHERVWRGVCGEITAWSNAKLQLNEFFIQHRGAVGTRVCQFGDGSIVQHEPCVLRWDKVAL